LKKDQINLKQKSFITELKEQRQLMSIDKDQINELDITSRLLDIITSMGEDEQADLLEKLEEWRSNDKRGRPRRSYFMPADYVIDEKKAKGLVKNLSLSGAFLNPSEVTSLFIGQEVLLMIPYPDNDRTVRVVGEIVRIDSQGVGIRFKRVSII
jgi:hypothetical protein